MGFLTPSEARPLPIRAVVLPRVTDERRSSARRTTRGQALLAVAPTTVLQVPGGAAATLHVLREVIASVPVYELRLGIDLDDVSGIVREIVENP